MWLTRKCQCIPLYLSYFVIYSSNNNFKKISHSSLVKVITFSLLPNFRFWYYPGLYHVAAVICPPYKGNNIHKKSILVSCPATYILILKGFFLVGWIQIMRMPDILYGKTVKKVRTSFFKYCKLYCDSVEGAMQLDLKSMDSRPDYSTYSLFCKKNAS